MNKVQKIIYWLMLIILVTAITTDVVTNDYKSTNWKVNTLFWCLAAWLAEARCAKLQKIIDGTRDYPSIQVEVMNRKENSEN
jgi:hypothetical protein